MVIRIPNPKSQEHKQWNDHHPSYNIKHHRDFTWSHRSLLLLGILCVFQTMMLSFDTGGLTI